MLSSLVQFYSRSGWRTPVLRERGTDPFVVLVSTILSHRTRDEVTERATLQLLTKYPTVEALARARLQSIRSIIRQVGLSEAKAHGLQDAARFLLEHHGGKLPHDEADLLEIPMVGPKTAHAIMVFGHAVPGLPIDVHILRVTRRLGVVRGQSIKNAQIQLARSVPRRYWGLMNPIFVQHGMNVCVAGKPRCGECPIVHWCDRVGVPGVKRDPGLDYA